ncbi:MAG: AbrB/MazE/SpoVT family DNA-binding domain-containing protein [Clostridia bacterium]|jgi:antitoxin MazE|nr:AbrB/MazE/SpoVT family DNA-binding domain-containing protein [Clostridia bacterium]
MGPRVQRWGNSLAIRLPKALAGKLGLAEGTPVELEVDRDRLVIYPRRYTLEELLAQVGPDNRHAEVDTGPPRGREEW